MMRAGVIPTVNTDFKNVTARKRGAQPADYWLAGGLIALLAIGVVLVASASITLADRHYSEPSNRRPPAERKHHRHRRQVSLV